MHKTVQSSGKEIFYRVHGEGKAIVLVHGFGETGDIWNGQIATLQKCGKLIIPDLPGSGRSEMVNDMSIEGMADVVLQITKAEVQDEKAIIIGHSMGGYITLAMAERNPGAFRALGLFHSTAYADSEEKIATRRKGIEFIRQHGAYEFLKTSIPNLFAPDSREKYASAIEELIREGNNFSPAALVSYYDAMIRRPDRSRVLETMKVPILFVLGKHDAAVPLQDTLALCALPDLSYIHVLHQSGHMGMLEEADRTNRILFDFISEN